MANHFLESKTNLEKVLNQLLSLLGVVCDVNIERDEMLIRSNYMKESGEDTLALLFPNLVQEWHPTKNGTLSPNDVKANSGLKVWWKCKEGHEWKAIINSRTRENGTGCPYCSGHRFLKGKNDLLTCFPEIAKEWHPTKNGELTPSDVTKSYNKKVWWLGKCGHEWEATVNNRTGHSKTKCPYCSNQKLLKGYNDLKTTFPSIAEEWHPSLNGELKPDDVMGGTVKKFWWICHNGHSYQASPHNRTNGKTGCPVCARIGIVKKCAVGEYPKSWIGRYQAA